MSWAEVKRLNSDLSTPLNILATINHIDMVGDKYVGYGDVKGTVSILETDAVYAHEIARGILADLVLSDNPTATAVTQSPVAFKKCLGDSYTWGVVSGNPIMTDYCETKLAATSGVGEWLAFLADSDNTTLKGCQTMTAVAASSTAVTVINDSSATKAVVLASPSAMLNIYESTTAMGIFSIRYGFKTSKGIDDPDLRVTYTHDAVGKTPASTNFTTGEFMEGDWGPFINLVQRQVMLKNDGTVDYELSQSDDTKKVNGDASDVSNTSYLGNAMVAFRNFKYVHRSEDVGYEYVTFCNLKYDETYRAYAHTNELGKIKDEFYWGKYKGSNISNKMRSLAGQVIMVNQTRPTEASYAQANGAGWYTIYKSGWDYIADLVTLVSKNYNGQLKFGQGRHGASSALATGMLKDKPMFMGYDNATSDVKVFGIEGFWGNVWEGMAGLILNTRIKVKMTPPYNFDGTGYKDTGIVPNGTSGGYVSAASVTGDSGYVPKTASGSATQYYCDGLWYNNSQVGYALVGGNWDFGFLVGPRCVNLTDLASATHASIGSRLSFLDPA